MTTKQLAKQLGLIRRSSKLSLNCKNGSSPKSKQFFQYLIIIDFESTCWKDIKHYGQEIIEFPAVLLNTSSGEIESEFHTYVQPQEHPILSEFCTELTGIKQKAGLHLLIMNFTHMQCFKYECQQFDLYAPLKELGRLYPTMDNSSLLQQQVEDGVPLKICLSQFSNWIQKLQKERGIIFPNVLPNQSCPEQKMCAFVTWSDWDLGVCLLYECKRKQLRKTEILNSWIDLRLTYKLFYNRKPKGLNGALQDVGIEFSGREHSGLDDSRNTARLAWRMICDGCVMKITKSLDKVRPCKPSEQSGMVLIAQTNGSVQEDGNPISDDKQDFKIHPTSAQSNAINEVRFTPFVLPSKITNKIGGRQQDGMMGVARVDVQPPQNLLNGLSTTILGFGSKYRHSNQNSLGPLQNRRQTGTFTSTPANNAHQCPSHVLFSTTIVSVNDVSGMEVDSSSDLSILADWEEAAVIADTQEEQSVGSGENEESVLPPVDSLSASVLRLDDYKPNLQPNTKSIPCHPSTLNSKSVVYRSPDTTIYNVSLKKQVSNNSTFKLPTALSNKPGVTPQTARQPSKTPSVLDYFPKRKLSSVSFSSPPKKLPFTIHEDQSNQTLPFVSGPSRKMPQTVLNSTVNLSSNNRPTKLTRITAPMCNCGRRAKKLTVSNGGPNQGRVFYSCAIRKRDDDGKGCSYFKWEDTLLKEKSLDSSSILSSSRISVTSNTSLASSACSETRKTFKLRPSLRT